MKPTCIELAIKDLPHFVSTDQNIIQSGTFDTESDSIMHFTFSMPSTSIQFTAWPSLNGIDRLTASDGEGFPFTAYYPAPEFTEVYFASSGKNSNRI